MKTYYILLIISISTPLVCLLSFILPSYIVPIICVIPAYPVMIFYLKQNLKLKAIIIMLFWAALLGLSMTLLIYSLPDYAKSHILNGEKYKKEMIEWVLTGIGKESNAHQFIPQHILELAIFSFLSLLSGSLLSIILGAFLMNYMSYYVAHLALHGKNAWLLLLGWHPWSLLRIISYVILGVILSEPLLSKLFKYNFKFNRKYLIIALAFWIADLTIKASLANKWHILLKSFFVH